MNIYIIPDEDYGTNKTYKSLAFKSYVFRNDFRSFRYLWIENNANSDYWNAFLRLKDLGEEYKKL